MSGVYRAMERLMGMSDQVWARHASPWSVYSRFAILPLLALVADPARQWTKIAEQLREVRGLFGKSNPAGVRRTEITASEDVQPLDMDAMIEREPVTVILSRMGWIRAVKGHQPLDAEDDFTRRRLSQDRS